MTKPIELSDRSPVAPSSSAPARPPPPSRRRSIIPSRLLGANAPSNRVRVGHIGAGRIAQGHDMVGVAGAGSRRRARRRRPRFAPRREREDARRAAVRRAQRAAAEDRRLSRTTSELLARTDIDAVTISLPDHQHAEVALRALHAGKDVYLQKPFTMTHAEGIMLRDAVAKPGRILQVGSQQRSWGPNEQFRKAVEFVRSGRVGNLRRVEIGLPIDPTAPDDPQQPVPPNLNYDMWLGPTPGGVLHRAARASAGTRRDGGPDVQSRPGWLRNENYSLGMITGWGAHHFDTAHWGMDMELTGPSKHRGQRRVSAEQDLERARQVSHRAHLSGQRHHDRVRRAAERHQVHRRRGLDLRLARRVADGERSVRAADVAQVARRERSEAARSQRA